MKTLIRFVTAFLLICFFTTGCIMGSSGDGNQDPGNNTNPGSTTDEPTPPEPTDPEVTPNFNDTVYIN